MNLQKLKQKTRLGNSGFSLVELIIVIAIMAILIAVLAPMFIRYVERSRQANDISAIGSIMRALEAAAADPTITPASDAFSATWSGGTGVITISPALYSPEALSTLGGSVISPDSNAMSAATVTVQFTISTNSKSYTSNSTNSDFSRSVSALN